MITLSDQIRGAKRAGVPLVAVETADPAQTIKTVCRVLMNGQQSKSPKDKIAVIEWDSCNSARGLNDEGAKVIRALTQGQQDAAIALSNPSAMLMELLKVSDRTFCFMHNAQRWLLDPIAIQAVWNLRDTFKTTGSMLIMLGPAITLPEELKHDVMEFEEPLPMKDEIQTIVAEIVKSAVDTGAKITIAPEELDKVCDTLTGLSGFACEQTLAMCISKDGVDKEGLWERKRRQVEMTDGLSIFRGGWERYSTIGGCENIKFYAGKLMTGKRKYRSILWLDEIEKMLAGAAGDTSGVSQDQMGVILQRMQDWEMDGMLFIGPAGASKSAMVKTIGNEYELPVVQCDLGAAKGSLVGESERKMRLLLKVFRAISNGQGLVIGTCNRLASMPPELRRRFNRGTFMFDLPTAEERKLIWPIYLKKYELPNKLKDIDFDQDWTGAEIKACCDIAWSTGLSLVDASQYIVPVAKSASADIEALRALADGRFISAGAPGIYTRPVAPLSKERRLEINQNN